MKLSQDGLEVLKNFSKINTEMLFQEGNVQFAISTGRNLFAHARMNDNIPKTFGIWDLNSFLGVLSLYDEDVELDFQEQQVIFRGRKGKAKTTYRYTPPKLLKYPPPPKPVFNEKLGSLSRDIVFDLSSEDFKWIRDTAQTLQSPHFSIEVSDGKVRMTTFDLEDNSKTTQTLDVGELDEPSFRAVFLTQNLRFLKDDYTVGVNRKGGTVCFAAKNKGVDYYLAAEAGHTKNG